ncbi:anti-sigma factor family protein [Phenylobacterium sp.]|uniref:anti-sigma factor family protein n=1 Tax=Phenylobacterium sp. TaxID=1871053 RepID=UPI002D10CD3A|nr:zf-HC2 domain-containing protein [Phenylobacterium sp.]HLZ74108.1 zf-HC2 domain-containing protein [Phenylobacterium sp.]
MSACLDKTILLQGLVDAELDAVNAAAFETHLKTCEGCHADFLRMLALREAVTAPSVTYRAPQRLRDNIEAMLSAHESAALAVARPTRARVSPWNIGGAGGLLAAGLGLMLIVPQMADNGLERQLVASHVRSLLVNHLTDVATADQHVVRPWFNGKVDVAPPVPQLADQGFPLVGGRLDYIDGRVAPAIVYKRRLHTVNLFAWPADERLFNGGKTVRRDGYTVEEWTAGGLRYAAVSDVDPKELKLFKAAFEAHSPDPSH